MTDKLKKPDRLKKLERLLYDEESGLIQQLTYSYPSPYDACAESIADDFLEELDMFLEENKDNKRKLNKLNYLVIGLVSDIVMRPEEFIPMFLAEICIKLTNL